MIFLMTGCVIIQNARKVDYKTTDEINDYLDSLPDSDHELVALHKQKIAEDNAEEFYSKLSEILTIKHESWSYENEHRIIHDGNNRNPQPGKITKMFLGAKMPPQDKRMLAKLIRQDIELVCMNFSKIKYGLTQRPLIPLSDFEGLGLHFES